MKKNILLLLGLSMCITLVSCAGDEAKNSSPSGDTPASTESLEESLTPSSTDYPEDLPTELGDAVTESVNAFINGKDIMQYVTSGDNISDFVTSDLIVEAMKVNDKWKPLVISDQLNLIGYEKQAKDEYLFTFTSEMDSNVSITYIRLGEDEWKITIDDLLTVGTFKVPAEVEVRINDTIVETSQYTSGSEIKVEGILANVPTKVTYETGLYKDYEGTFILDSSSGVQDARYVLGQDDTDSLIPKIESLWRSLQAMVVSGVPDNHWSLFYPDTRVTANMIITGWNASSNTPVEDLVLQGMELNRSDGITSAYLESKSVISINLIGSFLKVQGVADTKNISNWIKIVKEDNQIKLYDCSAEVWLGSGF